MPDNLHHVVLYQVIKTPHDTPVAARIESYLEGEAPNTVWSTMSSVDTQLDFIFGSVLQIVNGINDSIANILTELETNGWYIDSEVETDHQQDESTIYRTTHFTLRRREDIA